MRRRAYLGLDQPVREVPPEVRMCEHPDCRAQGLHRAPKARDRLNEYFWFCLDHVRAYNRAWDYYEGMDEREIEAHIRQDTVWQRPTWPLGGWGAARMRPVFRDYFGFFVDGDPLGSGRTESVRRGPRSDEERALAVLDLRPPVTLREIKMRYKILVKRLHPDANGGDKAAEERLKLINQAYSTLKSAMAE
jgi:curved DNA-binding protein CbpA